MTKRRRSLIAFLLCLIAVLFFIVVFGNLPFLKRGKPRFSVAVVGFMGTDSRTFKEAGDKLPLASKHFHAFLILLQKRRVEKNLTQFYYEQDRFNSLIEPQSL